MGKLDHWLHFYGMTVQMNRDDSASTRGQRAVELTVREAISKGRLKGNEKLPAKMTLTLGGTDLNLVIDGDIELQ